jgi:hypothetical protein
MKRNVCIWITAFFLICLLTSCSGSGGSGNSGDVINDDTAGQDDVTDQDETPVIPGIGSWNPDDFALVIDVGPGLDYETPSDVPWNTLSGSTLVKIHKRPEPYRSKWVITTVAGVDTPLVILGVSDDGSRPVISGDGAVAQIGRAHV